MPLDQNIIKIIDEIRSKYASSHASILREVYNLIPDSSKRPSFSEISNYLSTIEHEQITKTPKEKVYFSAGSVPKKVGKKPKKEYSWFPYP